MRKDELVTWGGFFFPRGGGGGGGGGEGIKVRHRAHDCNYGCRHLLLFFLFFSLERRFSM